MRIPSNASSTLAVIALLAGTLPVVAQDAASEPAASLSPLLEGAAFDPVAETGDDRRSLARFVPNLGRNIVGVFSEENLQPFLAGAAFTGMATRFDSGTARVLRGQSEGFGNVGQRVGALSAVAPVAFGLFAAGRGSSDARFRSATYDLAQAAIVTGLYTEAFKRAVSRVRPDASNHKSFPSGHTSNAFAWATVAQKHYGSKVGVPAYAVAGLIGISRIERNRHYLSDVVAGATLGLIVGRTVVRGDDAPAGRRRKEIGFFPLTDGNGGGLGGGVQVRF